MLVQLDYDRAVFINEEHNLLDIVFVHTVVAILVQLSKLPVLVRMPGKQAIVVTVRFNESTVTFHKSSGTRPELHNILLGQSP